MAPPPPPPPLDLGLGSATRRFARGVAAGARRSLVGGERVGASLRGGGNLYLLHGGGGVIGSSLLLLIGAGGLRARHRQSSRDRDQPGDDGFAAAQDTLSSTTRSRAARWRQSRRKTCRKRRR